MNMPMQRTEAIEVTGTVVESLPNATFRVTLDNGHRVMAQTGLVGTPPMTLVPGDKVTVAISPYDLSRGRITTRTR
jgi:translation initiation factor IF-1